MNFLPRDNLATPGTFDSRVFQFRVNLSALHIFGLVYWAFSLNSSLESTIHGQASQRSSIHLHDTLFLRPAFGILLD